jgi:NDP-sugar pyrophosphorylase family protein
MNSLIIIREEHYGWLRELHAAKHPAMVPICNKPILEYMVDFIVLMGGKKIRLVFEEPDGSVEMYFGNGERWGVDIDYGNARANDTIAGIVEKNSHFADQTPLMVIDGLLFLHYDKNTEYEISVEGSGTGFIYESNSGSISYRTPDGEEQTTLAKIVPDLPVSTLHSNVNLFRIAMTVLREEQNRYVIPGFGAEKGVILGRNVEIGKQVEINGPVVVGNNVRLLGNAVIGPNAVIAGNVIIDDGAEVRDSLVMADTYVGPGLYVSAKMVAGNRVLSFSNDASIEVTDDFLLSPIRRSIPLDLLRYLTNACAAMILAVFQFVPFCIIFALRWLTGDLKINKSRFLLSSEGNSTLLRLPVLGETRVLDRIIKSLSLDKFSLLKEVFTGKLRLVGNSMIMDSEEGREFVKDFADYSPGIFNYTEAERLEPGTAESEIAERYYSANRGALTEIKNLIKALTNNFMYKN